MDEKQFEGVLERLIGGLEYEDIMETLDISDDVPGLRYVAPYEEKGMLTNNKGLVVSFANGDEFQITIVQSGRSRRD